MKLFGQTITEPNVVEITIPRKNVENTIVFKAKSIIDFDEFDELCPEPEAPVRFVRGQATPQKATDDPSYIKAQEERSSKRMSYMIVKSLEATEGLEWETVDMKKPETWANYATELKQAHFNAIEINRIISGVMKANCLDEDSIKEAEERFLAMKEARLLSESSQTVGQGSTESGEPVKE
jgi:hypothetical protein